MNHFTIGSKDNDDKYIKDLFAIDDVLNEYAYITGFKKESNDDKLTITYEKGKKDDKSLYKHLLESNHKSLFNKALSSSLFILVFSR